MLKYISIFFICFLFQSQAQEVKEKDDDLRQGRENIGYQKDKTSLFQEDVINFAVVETPPIFYGCSRSASKDEKYACFQRGVSNHVVNNFKYPQISKEMGIQEKIYVQFIIDKKGNVSSAKVVRGEDKHLKKEALRLVNTLPKMIPARQKGKPVAVTFTMPINFMLN